MQRTTHIGRDTWPNGTIKHRRGECRFCDSRREVAVAVYVHQPEIRKGRYVHESWTMDELEEHIMSYDRTIVVGTVPAPLEGFSHLIRLEPNETVSAEELVRNAKRMRPDFILKVV